MSLVLTDGLQKTREKACANDLELGGLGVGQLNGTATVVFAVQPAEVLIVRAEDKRHDLGPAGHSGLNADHVGQLVDRQRLGDGTGLAGKGLGELVKAVGNRDILHDVALVEDVGASGGDLDVNGVRVVGGGSGAERHLLQQSADLGGAEVQATALVDVRHFGLGDTGSDVRGDASLLIVLGNNLDGLNTINGLVFEILSQYRSVD